MKLKPLVLGSHLSIAGGLQEALLAGRELGCQCVQLFVANQRQWRHPALTEGQIELFHQTRRKTGLTPVVAHSSYLINPAAEAGETRSKGLAALTDEFRRCTLLGIDYLVLHPGSHGGRGAPAGIRQVVAAIGEVFEAVGPSDCRLLLETTAGQGSSLGWRFEELAEILDRCGHRQRLGVCLDTCHVFTAGYDLRDEAAYHGTFAQFDQYIGLARLKVIHVNDSKGPLGGKLDRHEHLGKGQLGRAAFRLLVNDPRLRGLPLILETPKGTSPGGRDYDRLNLAALCRWAAK